MSDRYPVKRDAKPRGVATKQKGIQLQAQVQGLLMELDFIGRSLERRNDEQNWRARRLESMVALDSLLRFLANTGPSDLDVLPLRNVLIALRQAEEGVRHPLVAPASTGGKARDSIYEKGVKLRAALAMTALMEARSNVAQATATIRRALTKAGYRKKGKEIPVGTIRRWRDGAKKGKLGDYDGSLASLKRLPADEQAKVAMEVMIHFVELHEPPTGGF